MVFLLCNFSELVCHFMFLENIYQVLNVRRTLARTTHIVIPKQTQNVLREVLVVNER